MEKITQWTEQMLCMQRNWVRPQYYMAPQASLGLTHEHRAGSSPEYYMVWFKISKPKTK